MAVVSTEISDLVLLEGPFIIPVSNLQWSQDRQHLHCCWWEQTVSAARISEETLAENPWSIWRSGNSDRGVKHSEYPVGLSGDFGLGFGMPLTKQETLHLIARDKAFVYTM